MIRFLWLVPLGFGVGTFGTLIGAGGGFVRMPILLLLYPQENPELLTSISLAVVFFNALSGSIAYGRMGRIDYKSGMMFSAATIPGAILGAFTTALPPRWTFDALFGVLLGRSSGPGCRTACTGSGSSGAWPSPSGSWGSGSYFWRCNGTIGKAIHCRERVRP